MLFTNEKPPLLPKALLSLRETFRIADNTLISAKKVRYPLITYKSILHKDLAYVLKDPKQTEVIYRAYLQHIFPVIPQSSENTASFLNDPKYSTPLEEGNHDTRASSEEEAFSKALLDVVRLFGNPQFSPHKALIQALKEQGPIGANWAQEHPSALFPFVKAANIPPRPLPNKEKKDGLYKVAILTTSASGGNDSVARALSSFLEKEKNIQSILIDVETIAKEEAPMMLATNMHTYDGIYSSIFQKTNQFDVIFMREILNREIQKYIPSNFLGKLKEMLIEVNPDLIISTRSYSPDDISLSTLGIPFRMLHCDFELSLFLSRLYGKISPDSIRFWLPTHSPSIFKPLFEWKHSLDLYNDQDDAETLMQKVADLLHISIEDCKKEFEVLGYPTCPEFYPIKDAPTIEKLKRKWGVQEGEIPVFIVMGKHGMGALEDIFDLLYDSPPSKMPLKFFFICGQNPSLKKAFQAKLARSGKASSRFAIHGLLSPQEMNEVMNLSSLGISKAGGASVAEAIATKTPLLLMHSHPWEEGNAQQLEKMGLAFRFDQTKPLIQQIEICIERSLKQMYPSFSRTWQHTLLQYLEQLRKTPI